MRRWLIIAAALLIVLAAADTIVWRWAVGRVMAETALWADQRRAEGWTVNLGTPEPEGWPLAARIRVRDGMLATPRGGPFLATSEAVIGVALLQPQRLVIALPGHQQLTLNQAIVPFDADRFEIAIPLSTSHDPDHADLDISALRAVPSPGATPITVEQAAIHLDVPATQPGAVVLTGDIGPIDVPPDAPLSALGPRIDARALDATLSAERIELRHLDVTWGKLQATARFTITPDAKRQPSGTGEARLIGISDALDALVAARLVAPRPAATAKALLSLLQRPQPNGPPAVVLPLGLQDRVLQIGPYPIAKLSETTW